MAAVYSCDSHGRGSGSALRKISRMQLYVSLDVLDQFGRSGGTTIGDDDRVGPQRVLLGLSQVLRPCSDPANVGGVGRRCHVRNECARSVRVSGCHRGGIHGLLGDFLAADVVRRANSFLCSAVQPS